VALPATSAKRIECDAISLSMVGLLRRCYLLYTAARRRGPWTSAAATPYKRHGPARVPRSRCRARSCSASFRPLRRRRGGLALALVTADLESSIVAVELSKRPRLRALQTPADPRSIESIGGVRRDRRPHRSVAGCHWSTDSRASAPIRGPFGAPRYTAVVRRPRFAYVTDSDAREVAIVDLRAAGSCGASVGGPARHSHSTCSAPALGRARQQERRDRDRRPRRSARPARRRPFRPPFLAHDVGYEPRGARVWVTSGDRGRIAIYDDSRRARSFARCAPTRPAARHLPRRSRVS
jgi:hypothetical protein